MKSRIELIKQKMLDWQDFYGGDISASDEIKKAKTNKQLSEILDRHEAYMEDMLNDAKMHLKQFRTDIGLSWL